MPCPSMGPKLFWTVKIILVEYQSFWTGPIHFNQVQIVMDRSKLKKLVQKNLIWTWPKWFGHDQKKLDSTKIICTTLDSQNHFGHIEGQDISYILDQLEALYATRNISMPLYVLERINIRLLNRYLGVRYSDRDSNV